MIWYYESKFMINCNFRDKIRSKVICRVSDVYFSFIDTVKYSKSIEKYLLTEEEIQSQECFKSLYIVVHNCIIVHNSISLYYRNYWLVFENDKS